MIDKDCSSIPIKNSGSIEAKVQGSGTVTLKAEAGTEFVGLGASASATLSAGGTATGTLTSESFSITPKFNCGVSLDGEVYLLALGLEFKEPYTYAPSSLNAEYTGTSLIIDF